MTEIFIRENELFLSLKKWQELNPNLIIGFSSRNGGVSKPPFDSLNLGLHVSDNKQDILLNRNLLANHIQFPLDNWVSGEQIHHSHIHIVSKADKGKGSTSYGSSIHGTDGLITKESGVLCTAFFADCVPLFFYDPNTSYIGIAHAGWKGTVNRIAGKMVDQFKGLGVDISNLQVAIGPCISQEKYEVNDFVINQIPENLRANTTVSLGNQKFLLDLKQLNVEILLQSGVFRNNIDVTEYCTYKDESLFFSHRRDRGKTGRMLGYIGLKRF